MSGRRLRVRLATADDVVQLAALIDELNEDQQEETGRVSAETIRRDGFGPRPEFRVLLAELDGAPAGFALFFHNFSTFHGRRGLYLEDLYVRPAFRARGIGRQLMRHLARTAVERGCARFEWSVLDWNTDAIAFYRELGAVGLDGWTVQRVDGDALQRLAAAA